MIKIVHPLNNYKRSSSLVYIKIRVTKFTHSSSVITTSRWKIRSAMSAYRVFPTVIFSPVLLSFRFQTERKHFIQSIPVPFDNFNIHSKFKNLLGVVFPKFLPLNIEVLNFFRNLYLLKYHSNLPRIVIYLSVFFVS